MIRHHTYRVPLCRPAGWVALWRRLAQCGTLNTRKALVSAI
ncbi:hypothetical protein RR11_415 [Ruegeria sp. R11]|nr:hypothetical protein RR11_415 [Ruegeria sp. R11]